MQTQSIASTQATSKQLVSKVLSRAVKVWLRKQAEQVDALEIHISGNNRSILTGHISQVTVEASSAIYRGLHLSQVHLCASGIHINIGQVLKGKPLKLLQPFPVDCQISLLYPDFNTSLQSPLLINAIAGFLLPLIQSQSTKNRNFSFPNQIDGLQNLQMVFPAQNQLRLTADILSSSGELIPFGFQTELLLASPQELLLTSSRLELPQQQYWDLENMTISLGTDVYIEQLNITPEVLELQGQIQVHP
ncbi:DUF2993 domain-containing protein [Capilliphycus salinus ALCB114379]|uniref:LmeA family phospholipid-binding protein n=1 Tax=Capilliphycus salinus TaxID=2768948 RepID=UPI0039A5CCE5